MNTDNKALTAPVMTWESGEEFACFIESLEDDTAGGMGFDMSMDHDDADQTEHPCGTAMCIGGWCALALPPEDREGASLEYAASKMLGIDASAAFNLCFPDDPRCPAGGSTYAHVTPAHAGAAIRNAINFGDPNWKAVLKDVQFT